MKAKTILAVVMLLGIVVIAGAMPDQPNMQAARGNLITARNELLRATEAGGNSPLTAWDVAEVADAYRSFVAEHGGLRDRLAAGDVTPSAALAARVQVFEAWREGDHDDLVLATALAARWAEQHRRFRWQVSDHIDSLFHPSRSQGGVRVVRRGPGRGRPPDR